MSEPQITLDNVALGYGRTALMKPISLTVRQGDFWGIVGPNGAGKTTLIKTMVGRVRPVSGRATRTPPNLHFSYVPQRHTLDPEYPLSVHDVAMMGRYDHRPLGRRMTARDRELVHQALERLQMARFADRPFHALSGGQQQRVLIARALASEPEVLFLDEPTEGIDLPGEADILDFLGRLHAESGTTILMVVHHMEQVASVVDHLCLINRHSGLFRVGQTTELLGEQALSELYGRSVEITRCDDRIHVHMHHTDQRGEPG